VRAVETVSLVYFFYAALLAISRPLPAERRRQILAFSVTASALVLIVSRAPVAPAVAVARDWMPAILILLGYWASGRFFTAPMARWEMTLAAIDRRLLPGLDRWARLRPMRLVLDLLELAYLSVYVLVPAGFALLYFSGIPFDVDRFWTVVVAAELTCYGMLPWIQTRPPRAIEAGAPAAASVLRQANLLVLSRGSIQVNTFPSGHAAGAVATALAVADVLPAAGAVFGIWALAIVIGSVVGRYHYVADSVLGAAVAIVVWLIV
jgi:membrane-associated phospholipid phosphatase